MNTYERLKIRQMDDKLLSLKKISASFKENFQWIRTIRETLGMSTYALAKKCGVSQTYISSLEKREPDGRVTLQTLASIADKIDCDVFYAFIPRSSLTDCIEHTEQKAARHIVEKINNSMALEAQGLKSAQLEDQYRITLQEIQQQPLKKLWETGNDL